MIDSKKFFLLVGTPNAFQLLINKQIFLNKIRSFFIKVIFLLILLTLNFILLCAIFSLKIQI
jgi:hypothetical protein